METIIRKLILNSSYLAGACHLGSALSCVEILLAIDRVKRYQDVFLFSKASGVAAYYSLLAEKGIISREKIPHYLKNYPLASKQVPGIIHSVGSIGHGLNVAVGMAFANRKRRVYCLISDGELNEGSTWEAIMFAAHHNLANLIVVCDYNRRQACGSIQDILDTEDIQEKIKAFNWDCHRIYGHDARMIRHFLTNNKICPILIVAETKKGFGVDFMEDDYEWHYKNLTKRLLDKALKQL